MKRKKSTKIISFLMTFVLVFTFFVNYPVNVYAKTKVYHNWEEFRQDATIFLITLITELGAIGDNDAATFIESYEAFNDYFNEDHIDVDYDTQTVNVDAEFMTWLKECMKEYADQYEPYKVMKSFAFSEFSASTFGQRNIYDSMKNLVNEYPNGEIYLGCHSQTYDGVRGYALTVVEFEHPLEVAYVASVTTQYWYDVGYPYSWKSWEYLADKAAVYRVFLSPDDDAVQSLQEIKDKAYDEANEKNYWSYYYREYDGSRSSADFNMNQVRIVLQSPDDQAIASGIVTYGQLITAKKESVRVYTTKEDMMDYTVNRRKVYFTSDWYDKQPTAITVDLSGVEERLDDLDEVLKQLLEQISDNEDESRIEELLQQILDALNGIDSGGGSGDSSGGGTVVEYDDTTLRAQLSAYFSQVLSYLKQIVGKMPDESDNSGEKDDSDESAAGNISLPESLEEKLDEIIDQLKAIKRWSAIDAVASGADAVADWLSYISDLLDDAESGAGAVVGALSSAFSDTVGLLKAKFPFSLPWDVIAIVEVMAAEPETPVFVLPLHIDSLSYNYDFVIDMTDYEIISKISRTFLSLLYALGLIKLSGRFIEIKKGG